MTNCQICSNEGASPHAIAPRDDTLDLCAPCAEAAQGSITDGPQWQCLHEAIWSEVPAVKVTAWRMLHALRRPWANDLLDIAYLSEEEADWAQAGIAEAQADLVIHRDSNGAVLAAGDTVVLIKDLPVKGAGFTAKRGTAVRGISLVADNADHIEGRVEGQRIVILTQFVKKS